MRKDYKKKLLLVLLIFCFVVFEKNNFFESFSFFNNNVISQKLEVYFFDVGQADSILIKQANNTILIDAGNNEDGEYIVDYLKNNLSLEDIDLVFGTHPHEDHIGGLDNIIDSFDIGKIYMPDIISTSKTFDEVLDSIEYKNYYINVPEIDSEIKLGDMIFKILYTGEDEDDLNNSSIVLKLIFRNTSYLFTGDATNDIEKMLLDKDIIADVLKVGHHGSKYSTSSDFLNKVNPDYAIIMVGKDNDYGHPTRETLNKLEKNNIKIYRTDEDGTIKLVSDGNNIFFEELNISLNG